MQVILKEPMHKLGAIGDVVKVKAGYARNYLIPQNKALRATKDNLAFFEAKRAEIEKHNAETKAVAEKLAKDVNGKVVVVIRQASDDGRLYGSVNARDIAAGLQEAKLNVDRKQVSLNTVIKEIGIYPVRVVLHPEVIVQVKANVARSASEAEEALKGNTPRKKEAPAKSITEEVLEAEEAAEAEAAARKAAEAAKAEESAQVEE